ncbi:MAG: hypothetical protein Q8930_17995 [Bacillota bacterium]|nr:hypothetical protein [Bacillota bacterium]
MSEDERKLYDVLFPNDNKPLHINYGYFTGGSLRSLSILKSRINKNCIDATIIEDDKEDGSFFVRVLQKDLDVFLSILKSQRYKERKIPRSCTKDIQAVFGDN